MATESVIWKSELILTAQTADKTKKRAVSAKNNHYTIFVMRVQDRKSIWYKS